MAPHSLGTDLTRIIDKLCDKGLPRSRAYVAVIMATRQYAVPVSDLVGSLQMYPALDDPTQIIEAVTDLLNGKLTRKPWLKKVDSSGTILVSCQLGIEDLIGAFIGEKEIAKTISDYQTRNSKSINLIGPIETKKTWDTYRSLISNAQSRICMPMLATTPKLEVVPLLQERAQSGVNVQILLATPSLAGKLRGKSTKKIATERIEGWKENARKHDNIEVKVTSDPNAMLLATCMLVDDKILRFDVYDIARQASKEGIMIQFENEGGLDLNIVRLFHYYFDTHWDTARKGTTIGVISEKLSNNWQIVVSLLLASFSYYFYAIELQAKIGAVFGSASASFLINYLVDIQAWLRMKLRRVVRILRR